MCFQLRKLLLVSILFVSSQVLPFKLDKKENLKRFQQCGSIGKDIRETWVVGLTNQSRHTTYGVMISPYHIIVHSGEIEKAIRSHPTPVPMNIYDSYGFDLIPLIRVPSLVSMKQMMCVEEEGCDLFYEARLTESKFKEFGDVHLLNSFGSNRLWNIAIIDMSSSLEFSSLPCFPLSASTNITGPFHELLSGEIADFSEDRHWKDPNCPFFKASTRHNNLPILGLDNDQRVTIVGIPTGIDGWYRKVSFLSQRVCEKFGICPPVYPEPPPMPTPEPPVCRCTSPCQWPPIIRDQQPIVATNPPEFPWTTLVIISLACLFFGCCLCYGVLRSV